MKNAKSSPPFPLLAALVGFLAGCGVMYFVWSRGIGGRETQTSVPARALAPVAQAQMQAQAGNDSKSSETGMQTTALRGIGARRVLNEIKRDKTASAFVNVRFFATASGKLSQQFMDFFELSPDEAGELSDLIQATKAEMWRAANAQAQVSQTETGGVIVKIPPIETGADIYDKFLDGFHAVLGDDRFNDMILYSSNQFERLFNQFGGEESTITIEKGRGDRYEIKIETGMPTNAGMGWTSQSVTMNPDEIRQWKPELMDYIPGK